MLRHYQKRSKKCISTSNFETSSHRNVTAKKPIRNIYSMYVDMAWLHSLSRLEHDMLHSTVWPMHKICSMSMCWRPYPTRTKRILFFAFPSRNAILYNRNLWFLLKIRACPSCGPWPPKCHCGPLTFKQHWPKGTSRFSNFTHTYIR